MKLNLERVVIILLVCMCGYLIHINNELKQSNKLLYNMIEYQKEEIKELNSVIKKSANDLEEMNKELEQLLQKNLVIAEVEEIKYAEAEHREIEKHLGESFYFVDVKCTAYSAGDNHTPGTIMANGEEVRVGAVAYNDVPLGTKVEIDGVVYTVCDRVGSDGVVDIYMDTIDECFDFGVQYKTVKVYSE